MTLLGQLVDCRIRMGAVVPARQAQEQAVRVARAEGRDDLLTAAYTTWTEPTPWRVRAYAEFDPEAVGELGKLLESPGLADRQRCLLLDQLADALDDIDPRAVAVAHRALELARTVGEPRLLGLTLSSLLRRVDCELDPAAYAELHRELAGVAASQDSPEYSWMTSYTAARIAAGRNDPAEMERCLVRADGIARTYELQGAFAVARLRGAMLAMAQGRFDDAEQTLGPAVAELRAQGAVDLSGLAGLAIGCIRLQQGRLAEVLPMVLAVWEQYQPLNEAMTALALLAAGRPEQAGRSSAAACRSGATSPTPSWPGCAARPPSPSATGRRPTRCTGTCCPCAGCRAARAASASPSGPSPRPWATSPGSWTAPSRPAGTTSKPRRWRPPGTRPSGRAPRVRPWPGCRRRPRSGTPPQGRAGRGGPAGPAGSVKGPAGPGQGPVSSGRARSVRP
ncbi:hypothetical protein ACFQ0M_46910 [Kitasatospora aburaviensis]